MNIAAWLASLVPSFVARVLLALGMGVVTITGLTEISTQLQDMISGSLAGWPSAAYQLAALAGLGDGLGIIIGAIVARITLYTLTQGAKIMGVGA